MDGGAWRAARHETQRVGHNRAINTHTPLEPAWDCVNCGGLDAVMEFVL